MSEADDLKELQNLTVPEIVEKLPALDDAALAELRKLEGADGRSGVLAAIDGEQKARAERAGGKAQRPAKAAAAEKATPGAKAATEADTPADPWRAADYTGPLTADQAEWRNAHIKPVQVDRTK